MSRHLFAARLSPQIAVPFAPARLEEARPIDLLSLRLVLRQHLDELRSRGADDEALRPIEEELRRYSQAVDQISDPADGGPIGRGPRL